MKNGGAPLTPDFPCEQYPGSLPSQHLQRILLQPWSSGVSQNNTTCTLHEETTPPVPCIKTSFVKKKRRVAVMGISLLRGMEARPDSQESLLSPRNWGKGHYWKTSQSSKAFWLLSVIVCLNWQQGNNKQKCEGNQKRFLGPGVIGRAIRSTGIDFRYGSEKYLTRFKKPWEILRQNPSDKSPDSWVFN